MRKQLLYSIFAAILLFCAVQLSAQVGINTDNSAPDSSAMLDVKSTTKGFLPPRVALTAINSANPITAPVVGLLVYNTENTGIPPNNVMAGYYCWSGTKWMPVVAPQGTNIGDMLYWNGTQWVGVPVGANGQTLTLNNGVPTWGGVQLPFLITTAVSNIAPGSATSGGNIISDGSSAVTARGICWNTTPNPTILNNHNSNGSGTGVFISNFTGLVQGTIYYVRAYATNSVGTSYGNEVTFMDGYNTCTNFGGGVIFYIDSSGQHGLIAATTNQSTEAWWGCQGYFLGNTSVGIGTGQANTTAIVNGCSTAGIAARVCDDLVLNGYGDWFLPSKDELFQMNMFLECIGGQWYSNYFWNSSECDSDRAWIQFFDAGQKYCVVKNVPRNVRCIRAF